MQNTVVQELIEIISKVDNEYLIKNAVSLVLNRYLEAEKLQITESFVAGYQCAKMEDMIGGTGNKENKYYENTYKK